jgi:hypothetical protein
MRVDDDDFVGPPDGFEGALDVGGLVAGDDRNGQLHTGSVQLPAASCQPPAPEAFFVAGSWELEAGGAG